MTAPIVMAPAFSISGQDLIVRGYRSVADRVGWTEDADRRCAHGDRDVQRCCVTRHDERRSPRERDQVKISARIAASVSAEEVRPTGPAATAASAPSVNLLDSNFSAPRGFSTPQWAR